MKKNNFLRIAAITVVMAMFATCILSGTTTLAKYASAATGSAGADIAAWKDIMFDTDDVIAGTIATADLFGNIQHHAAGDDQDKLAPGTFGDLSGLDITNGSDVDITVTVEIDLDNLSGVAATLPATFTINGTAITAGGKVTFTTPVIPAQGGIYTLLATDFAWDWDFDDGDTTDLGEGTEGWAIDTPIGIAGGSISLPVAVYAIQEDI